jgi:hypothetical protein
MSTNRIAELERELAQRKTELEKLIKEEKEELAKAQAEIDNNDPLKQLAIQLHTTLCTWNHTDGCGWYYEVSNERHDWNGHSHKDWLKKAREVSTKLDEVGITQKQAFEVIRILK